MSNKNENLEHLLQQFVDASQADAMANDIRYADTAFDTNPAPSVGADSLSAVRQHVRMQLIRIRRRHALIRWFSTTAAAVLVLTGIWLFYPNPEKPSLPKQHFAIKQPVRIEGFYTSDLYGTDIENDISDLAHAVENASDRTNEPVNKLQLNLNEIEDQLIANSTEFWKG